MTVLNTLSPAPIDSMLVVGKQIHDERLKRGWTMSELVRRTGINRGTLYRLERGETERPQVKTIQALARAFDISTRSLIVPFLPGNDSRADEPLAIQQRFDRATNPVVSEVVDEQPFLFAGWTDQDMDELYSTFGTGGQLTRQGVVSAAEAINCKRETVRKLHVILETGLRDQAVDLIDALFRLVRVTPPASRHAGGPHTESQES
jgi:transcriptional regulator with XRE-family HTH domain